MSILDVVRGFVARGTNGKGDTMQTIAVDEFGLVTVMLPAVLFHVAFHVARGGLAAFVA